MCPCPQGFAHPVLAEDVHERHRHRELLGACRIFQRLRDPAGERLAPGAGDHVAEALGPAFLPAGLAGADQGGVGQPVDHVIQGRLPHPRQPVMGAFADALAHRVRVQRLLGEQPEHDEGKRAAQFAGSAVGHADRLAATCS